MNIAQNYNDKSLRLSSYLNKISGMRYIDSITSQCRYGDDAEGIWGNSGIIWEDSQNDYSGKVEFIAKMPDGRFSYYMYYYGSCSGCDEWESQGYGTQEIIDIMRDEAIWFDTSLELAKFMLLGELNGYKDTKFQEIADYWLEYRSQE